MARPLPRPRRAAAAAAAPRLRHSGPPAAAGRFDGGTFTFTPIFPHNEGVQLDLKDRPGTYYGGVVAEVVTTEGVTVSGSADVIVPRDFDEDGVDDVIELEAGLDPTDRGDADQDLDEDGLTMVKRSPTV